MKILLVACALAAVPAPRERIRAIWVTRHEYKTESDVRAIVADCASLGFNTILFQVRGHADAYYRSRLEPWGRELGGADPGFDPLEVACRESRRRGLALHAWINVMPAWSGRQRPTAEQLCARHPEWLMTGLRGDGYSCFNPELREVRAHLAAVARDIASRYPIDGLHLDYIRYLEGDGTFDAKRRGAVTETVREIRRAVAEARPEATLSAAVFATAKSRREVCQDAEGWVRDGLVDAVFPMTYNADDGEHRREVEEGRALFKGVCFPGVGAYKHRTAEQTARQIGMSPAGFAVFSYASLSGGDRLGRARREAVRRALAK